MSYIEKIKFEHNIAITGKSKAKDDDELFLGYIEGLAATDDRDRDNDIITEPVLDKGAKSLKESHAVFLNHDWQGLPVGKVMKSVLEKTDSQTGIKVKVGISNTASKVVSLIEEGILNKFSIGGFLLDYDVKKVNDVWVGFIKDMEIVEVSVVGVPANPSAEFSVAMKSAMAPKIKKVKIMAEENNEIAELKQGLADMAKAQTEMLALMKAQQEAIIAQMKIATPTPAPAPQELKTGAPMADPEPEAVTFSNPESEHRFHMKLLGEILMSKNTSEILLQGSYF